MRRLRLGEAAALVGAVTLAIMLFLPWYAVPAGTVDARTGACAALGVVISSLLGIVILLCLGLAVTTVTRRSPAVPVALGVLTWVLASVVWIVLLIRLLHEPGLGLDLDAGQVTLRWPGYVGLLALAVIALGGLQATRDERTDAPESAYTPPPPRPIPEPAKRADVPPPADS